MNRRSSSAHTAPLRAFRKFPHGCCQRANIGGGGLAGTLHGGGDNAQVTYAQPGAGGGGMHLMQAGRTARFAGSDGSGPKFEYGPPAAEAGREAWVTGGGDDAQVTYGRRAR